MDGDDRIRLESCVGTKQVDCYVDLKLEKLAFETLLLPPVVRSLFNHLSSSSTPCSRLKCCRNCMSRGPVVCGT